MPALDLNAQASTRAGAAVTVAIAVALVAPVTLFTFANFEVNLTLLIAPLAGLCLFRAPALLRKLFLACIAAGLISVGLMSFTLGDQLSSRYLFSLTLVLTCPLYFFLGSHLCERYCNFDRTLMLLGIVSTGFVVVLAIQVIATDSQVRWYIGELGYTVLNVTLIGLPLYGSFGVMSLASLLVLHLFVIGAAFSKATRRWEQCVLVSGFAAAAFLVTGSNARSAQLALPYLVVTLGLGAAFGGRQVRVRAGILLAVGGLSVAYSSGRMVEELRIVSSARAVLGLPETPRASASRVAQSPGSHEAGLRDLDIENLSTGRKSLLEDALHEIALSPIFGNGFASYNRIDPGVGWRSRLSGNRTTHIHYLTILWKGGVLFFLPYIALLGAFWWQAGRGSLPTMTAGIAFLFAGLVFLFSVLSLSWDILLVPSAGAYAFFLLGAVSQSARRGLPAGDADRIVTLERSGRFLFIGFLVPDRDIERVFEGEAHPQISAVRFQRRLVGALTRAGVSIDAVTTPPIATYPRNRHWWVPGADYELIDLGVRGRQIAGLNLPGTRLIARLVQFLRHGVSALDVPCEGILVYSVHTPLVLASLLLKRLRGVSVFVFIPDLPTFMGGPSNPLKRLMKRLDAGLVRRLLASTDGAFPVTEGIGRDWLVRGPRYWAIEGVSDEAAAVLSRARATEAYVFRGARRPRLLYTGTLAT